MNDARADSAISFKPKREGPVAPEPRGQGRWTLRRWLILIALVFIAHVILIFIFGAKNPAVSTRAIRQDGIPQLALADNSSELIALDDPTLFALPHGNDFAITNALEANQPSFRWTGPPGELASPAAENLGAVISRFMETNQFATLRLDFKPDPRLSQPALALTPDFAENSSLRVEGELARRKLLTAASLTNWPYAGVIAPSRVQVLVDADGDVVSAVLLAPGNFAEAASRYNDADQRALEIARALRFSPAARATFGQLIFNWLTVPPAATNAP